MRKKYNPDNIFKNVGRQANTNSTVVNKEGALVEIKENNLDLILKAHSFWLRGFKDKYI